jgi:hypothetical protein
VILTLFLFMILTTGSIPAAHATNDTLNQSWCATDGGVWYYGNECVYIAGPFSLTAGDTLTVPSGITLWLDDGFEIDGTLILAGPFVQAAGPTGYNYGTVQITTGDLWIQPGLTFDNYGTINNDNELADLGTLNNCIGSTYTGNAASGGGTVNAGGCYAATTTSVNCAPTSVASGSSTTCTATVTGLSPSGTVVITSTSLTGTFTPSNGQCTLSSGSCSVGYSDNSFGSPTLNATYSGDSQNYASWGNVSLSVYNVPQVPQDPCEYGGYCYTSFIAFNVTSSGQTVDANVTLRSISGPTMIGTTAIGTPLRMSSYVIATSETLTYVVTLPDGQSVNGTVSNPDPWTTEVVEISG